VSSSGLGFADKFPPLERHFRKSSNLLNGVSEGILRHEATPNCRRKTILSITIVLLLTSAFPRRRAQAQSPSAISKLSTAVQQILNSGTTLVWANPATQTIRVLIQTFGPVDSGLLTAIGQNGGSVVRQFASIDGVLAALPISSVLAIAALPQVERITADHLAQETSSHLEAATGADQVRSYGFLNTISGLDGTGVGIAVLDSGIMSGHSDFSNGLLSSRVAGSTDIVSGNQNLSQFESQLGLGTLLGGLLNLSLLASNDDGFGHGSHVAGVIAGRSSASWGSRGYMGIAPNASLVDVRVLDGLGLGQVSDVLAGIDWVMAHRAAFNIRVMNLSLASSSTESYVTDPLCRAARRAVAAGITVVAAAGNFGSSPYETYGSISCPGNDPTVITVGSANTHQTDQRGDDTVNFFSSRGPTRGYQLDASGNKQYDNLLKPDLVAPGNRIISVQSAGCTLINQYPGLHQSGSGSTAFMQLSGTSIASPAVAGTAALLLQKNPSLTPPLIKAILQYSAEQIPNANISEQGAGLLNIEGAAQLAGALRRDISGAVSSGTIHVGDSLLAPSASMPGPSSTLDGQNFAWGGYIFAGGSHLLAGAELFRHYQRIYDPAVVWVRGQVTINGTPATDCQLITAHVIDADPTASSYGVFTPGWAIASGLASGTGVTFSQGVMLTDGVVMAGGVTLAEGLVLGSGVTLAEGGATLASGVTLAEADGTLGQGVTLAESYNSSGEP
jgi:serine protease AprX